MSEKFPTYCPKCGKTLEKKTELFRFDHNSGNKIFKVKFVCPTKNFLGLPHATYSSWVLGGEISIAFLEDEDGNPIDEF